MVDLFDPIGLLQGSVAESVHEGGQGGGRDIGKDKGQGPGEGAGRIANKREKRQLRWAMTFNTQNGVDYLNQLDGLGAIVAIPQESGQFLVYHNLKNPREAKVEDITKFNRIYWVDDKPPSVAGVMDALGLQGMHPSHFVAFMPEKLEKKLFEMELNYKGLKEDQIHETKFEVVKTANGYEPRVIDQTPKSAVGR